MLNAVELGQNVGPVLAEVAEHQREIAFVLGELFPSEAHLGRGRRARILR